MPVKSGLLATFFCSTPKTNVTHIIFSFHYRFESFNSVTRQMNLSTNRQACSRDIGKLYTKRQILKYVINGGSWGDNHRYCRVSMLKLLHFHCLQYISWGHILPFRKCASSQLQCLAKNGKLLKFMYQDNIREQSEKEIYQPGSLRLVSTIFNKVKKIHYNHSNLHHSL